MSLRRSASCFTRLARWESADIKLLRTSRDFLLFSTCLLLWSVNPAMAQQANSQDEVLVELGRALFFDTSFSASGTQACATCHDPQHAFIDSRNLSMLTSLSLGSDGVSLGERNAPTLGYVGLVPEFGSDEEGVYSGGLFHDGRAFNLQAQVSVPLMHPKEMAMPSEEAVLQQLLANPQYVQTFVDLFGEHGLQDATSAVQQFSQAIAAFERSAYFAPFDSKYDRYLRGEYTPTVQEQVGMGLFFSPTFTSCNQCHQLPGTPRANTEAFSNYRYENIGLPANPAMNALNQSALDLPDEGLSTNVLLNDVADETRQAQRGKFRVPTLRNIAITAPYMHNGVFKDLRTVLLFYNKYNSTNVQAQTNPESQSDWGPPEISDNVATDKLRSLFLVDRQIDALMAFLMMLTDQRYEYLLENVRHETR